MRATPRLQRHGGEAGATCTRYSIVHDDPGLLWQAIAKGMQENDLSLYQPVFSGNPDFTASVIADPARFLHG